MLFNSIDFALFLPIVFITYWAFNKTNLNIQNGIIVLASYFFYGLWDWRFLGLIFLSTLVDFTVAKLLYKVKSKLKRKFLLWISLFINLGALVFFKYYNFFIDNFVASFNFFGSEINIRSLQIILPVGISFYTFQTLSYTIDVYREKIEPTRNLLAFTAFVSFFPQLVAGPIERASQFLPQFLSKREFNYSKSVDGLRQMLWGLFKKVVIADNCAIYVDEIFSNADHFGGTTLIFGSVLFAFQIYGDFSGYSDIAIGTARLFGFNLMKNFAFPYFSRDIAEFWRRWHISLSTWFRDYVYIPLGGSKGGKASQIRNTFIIFLVSGFWHGANWTFIVWGFLNALYFLPLLLLNKNRENLAFNQNAKTLPTFKTLTSILVTFSITCIAWVFFRADNISRALTYIHNLFYGLALKTKYVETLNYIYWDFDISLFLLISLFLIMEWKGKNNEYAIEKTLIQSRSWLRYTFYYLLIFSLFLFGSNSEQFIYFQF